MLAPPDSNTPTGGDRQPSRAELNEANAAMAAELAALKAQMAADAEARAAAPPPPSHAPHSAEAWTLLTKLLHNGKEHQVGDVVPFDPINAPKGCDGLEEGVHFTRSRVLRG